MSDKKDELPGFYRDPKTGKYYRERSEGIEIPSLKKLKKERENETLLREYVNKCSKTPNVLKYLRMKELGQMCGLHAEREYYKIRTCNKWLTQEVSLKEFQPYDIVSVDLIKGSRTSVFGVWNIKGNSNYTCVVGERTFEGLPHNTNLGFKASTTYVIDMCEGPDDTVVYLYNNPFSGEGCFGFLQQTSDSIDTYSSNWGITKTPIFCCSAARSGSTFAFGCEGFIRFYNRFICEKIYAIRGRVHTISFDDSSNIMVSGIHCGHLYLHDIREKKFQAAVEVSDNCLNDSYFLSSNEVILAGLDSLFCKMDLRMKKVVTEYLGHKTSIKKRPFSVANNMICASGADNTIRIWHISGGNPIYEMRPVNNQESIIRGWLHSDCNKTYLHQFEEHFERIYQIT